MAAACVVAPMPSLASAEPGEATGSWSGPAPASPGPGASGPPASGAGVFDAKAAGAVGDGVADDTVAVQAAIDAASAAGGGWAYLPSGRYRILGSLHVRQAVTLLGSGWATPPRGESDPSVLEGSWLVVDPSSGGASAVVLDGRGGVVRDLGMWHQQPAPGPGWHPRGSGWAIEARVPDVLVRHVHLANATFGIRGFGRTTIQQVSGQPLAVGIRIEGSLDVTRIRDVSFTPTWSTAPAVVAYQRAQGVGIDSRRDDNPDFSGITLEGYGIGVLVRQGMDGITSKLALMDAAIRSCGTAIVVDAQGTIGAASRVDISDCDEGIVVRSPGTLTLASVHARRLGGSALRADIAGAAILVDDLDVTDWALTDPTAAAIEASPAGATIRVGPTRVLRGACDRVAIHGHVSATDRGPTVAVPAPTPLPPDEPLLTAGALDASSYGTAGDGVADDSGPIQAALDAAGDGGEVRLRAGTYRLGSGVSIPTGVTLTGVGFQAESTGNFDPATGAIVHPFSGTYFLVPQSNTGVAITIGDRATLRNVGMQHEQSPIGPGWSPFPFDWAVRLAGTDATVRDLFLVNPTKGVEVAPSARGRAVVDRVMGEPLELGLHVDSAAEVRVDAVHFWPFFGFFGTGAYGTTLATWVQEHAVGVRLDRSDHSELGNVFVFGYQVGSMVRTGGSVVDAAASSLPMPYVWNFDADLVLTGIDVDGAGATATFVNARTQGDRSVNGAGIVVHPGASDANIVLRNANVGLFPASALVIGAPSARVSLDLAVLRNNRTHADAPALDTGPAPEDRVGALLWPFNVAPWPVSTRPWVIEGCQDTSTSTTTTTTSTTTTSPAEVATTTSQLTAPLVEPAADVGLAAAAPVASVVVIGPSFTG